MRLVCCSDIHGQYTGLNVPDGDVFIFAGDLSRGTGTIRELQVFNLFLDSLPHKHKIVIAGNHDRPLERDKKAGETFLSSAAYLEDKACIIDGIKFYGSPWQPWFYNWAFNLPRGKPLQDKWVKIPSDTNVLITHGPPAYIMDEVGGQNQGCVDLLERVKQLPMLKVHCFGHIHPGFGVVKKDGVVFANVSICDDGYNLIHQPTVIDI
jgi:Icc-related predicted phosphoesterase